MIVHTPTQHNVNIPSLELALTANNLVYVTFKTKAGTTRVMGCTKFLESIPENEHDGRFDSKLNHESIVCVWDYQNSAWRSFRKDAVIGFEVV